MGDIFKYSASLIFYPLCSSAILIMASAFHMPLNTFRQQASDTLASVEADFSIALVSASIVIDTPHAVMPDLTILASNKCSNVANFSANNINPLLWSVHESIVRFVHSERGAFAVWSCPGVCDIIH